MCCVEWFAGSFGRSSGGLTLEIFCTLQANTWTKLQKISKSCSPHRHSIFLAMRKISIHSPGENFYTSGGRTFGCVPELAFKISIPIGDLAGRENWSTALIIARLSGHRNFTEQNRTPDAILRQAKAPPKSKCLTEDEKFP